MRPRATGLERRLEARGGFCDPEVFCNAWTLRADLRIEAGDGQPAGAPPSAGPAPRSSQPCANWEPRRGFRR